MCCLFLPFFYLFRLIAVVEYDENSRAQTEFDWNDEISFINIISALFNNRSEMKVVDLGLQVIVSLGNLRTSCSDQVSGCIERSMNDDFHIVIADFAAKEMSTRTCNMFDKWINQNNLIENHIKIIEEIRNSPIPNPIGEFEVVFY